MNQLAPLIASVALPANHVPTLIAAAGDQAGLRFLEFFTGTVRNPHTHRVYGRATTAFLAWCEDYGVPSIAAVQPLHIAALIEQQMRAQSAPTVKQQLAAIRHLFSWLIRGQIVPANPAASMRGPSHVVKRGRTPVLGPVSV